jgi:hypothetical protein
LNDTDTQTQDMIEEEEETAVSVCYICYESKDISGQATIRDCSCRGTGGYVHQSCLEVYTIQKAMHQRRVLGKVHTGILLCCGICKQRYQGQLRTDLWNAIVDHVALITTSNFKKKAYLRRLAILQTIISCLRAVLCLLDTLDLYGIIYVSSLYNSISIFSSLWIHHNLILLFDMILVVAVATSNTISVETYRYLLPFLINIGLYGYKAGLSRGIELYGKRFDVNVVQNSEEMGVIIFAAMSEKHW